jgi:hypothetical protein
MQLEIEIQAPNQWQEPKCTQEAHFFPFDGKARQGEGMRFFFKFGVSKCSPYGSFVFPPSAQ